MRQHQFSQAEEATREISAPGNCSLISNKINFLSVSTVFLNKMSLFYFYFMLFLMKTKLPKHFQGRDFEAVCMVVILH